MAVKKFANKLIKDVMKITLSEWDAVKKQELTLKNTLSFEQCRLRGIRLPGLILDPTYLKHVDANGDVEIRLEHDYPVASTARAFRRGKLVDLVIDSDNAGDQKWTTVKGIISKLTSDSILVQVSSLGDNFLLSSLTKDDKCTCLDLQQRSTSYIMKVACKSLKDLKVTKHNYEIASQMVGKPLQSSDWCTTAAVQKSQLMREDFLDQDKVKAVELCSQCHPVTIIHGPPGTGKTTALAAAILSALANGNRILACAPSHAAVDALTMAVIRQWNEDLLQMTTTKNLLRVGNVLRLKDPRVAKWLPVAQDHGAVYELKQLRSDLITDGTKGKGFLIQEERQVLQKLKKQSKLETFDQIKNAKVVLATCLTAMLWPKELIQGFDVVCIDEAAFAQDWLTFPLALSGISRLILSGDHYQLPPVRVSNLNTNQQSLMEVLIDKVSTARLTQQFRSNSMISGWSSQYFYQGVLKAHESVCDINLRDLIQNTNDQQVKQKVFKSNVVSDLNEKSAQKEPFKEENILVHDTNDQLVKPLIFIDTTGQNYAEEQDGQDGSIANYNEAYLVELLVQKYVELGVVPDNIGIISPYWSQVALLRDILAEIPVEISTVDGFQGCEKEMIIISFVRSNLKKTVGFLSEVRRINVSVTRAKRCCLVIGDVSTLRSDPGLNSFIDYCAQNYVIFPVDNVIKTLSS
jgi:hypothetical protein